MTWCWGPSRGKKGLLGASPDIHWGRSCQEEAGADLSEKVHSDSEPMLLQPHDMVRVAGHGGRIALLVRVGADPSSRDMDTRWRISSGRGHYFIPKFFF